MLGKTKSVAGAHINLSLITTVHTILLNTNNCFKKRFWNSINILIVGLQLKWISKEGNIRHLDVNLLIVSKSMFNTEWMKISFTTCYDLIWLRLIGNCYSKYLHRPIKILHGFRVDLSDNAKKKCAKRLISCVYNFVNAFLNSTSIRVPINQPKVRLRCFLPHKKMHNHAIMQL